MFTVTNQMLKIIEAKHKIRFIFERSVFPNNFKDHSSIIAGSKIEAFLKTAFMKKILPVVFVLFGVISCNNGDTKKTDGDTANTSAPSSIKDTGTQHPNGMTSDGVISTDTSAFGVKANSAHKKH